jgi:hypothetical protein
LTQEGASLEVSEICPWTGSKYNNYRIRQGRVTVFALDFK